MRPPGITLTLRARVLASFLCVALVAPISAEAARVFGPDNSNQVRILDEGAEVNDVIVRGSRVSGDVWTVDVRDVGSAPLVAGRNCEQTATGVTCTGPHRYEIVLELRRGNDQIDATGLAKGMYLIVRAGAGNDRVLGSLGAENYFLRGGAGDDFFRVGPTAPYAEVDGGPGADHIIGGNRSFEFLEGGPGADRLEGRSGVETLREEEGDDLIRGGDGRDRIYPDVGEDEVLAGAGDDQIYPSDGERDIVDCGGGHDRVEPDAADLLFGCEAVVGL